tara:strand:+ start:1526 stop:1735 length:210 start_codon:yes stop_codon:yes gene_type:complete
MNEFKCPSCDKMIPFTKKGLYGNTCSNFMSKGRWVCKSCFNAFGGDMLEYVEDIDQQAFAQERKSSYGK